MTTPAIILYQDGPSPWWPWALRSLRDWCDAPVHMITNEKHFESFSDEFNDINLHSIEQYRHHADALRKGYFNKWDSKSWFIGFERFAILNAFVNERGIKRFFTFDSDFLLFCDPLAEANKFSTYDFTISMGCGTHDMFWNNMECLDGFVRFCHEVMDRDFELTPGEKTVGSFSDMHALMMFKDEHTVNVGEMTDVRLGVTWDNNLKQNYHGYSYAGEDNKGKKRMRWENGQPYCQNVRLQNAAIRFAGLHVSSYLKVRIPEVYKEARCSISATAKA